MAIAIKYNSEVKKTFVGRIEDHSKYDENRLQCIKLLPLKEPILNCVKCVDQTKINDFVQTSAHVKYSYNHTLEKIFLSFLKFLKFLKIHPKVSVLS